MAKAMRCNLFFGSSLDVVDVAKAFVLRLKQTACHKTSTQQDERKGFVL
jgi:hypothetical protein